MDLPPLAMKRLVATRFGLCATGRNKTATGGT